VQNFKIFKKSYIISFLFFTFVLVGIKLEAGGVASKPYDTQVPTAQEAYEEKLRLINVLQEFGGVDRSLLDRLDSLTFERFNQILRLSLGKIMEHSPKEFEVELREFLA